MTTTAPPPGARVGSTPDDGERVEPVSVRIALFGGPRSGVTSSVRVLGERLSQPVTETGAGEVTRSLDWLEYEGGRHDGRSIRTQVVGLSGTVDPTVASVLATADVVLFVADTTEAGLEPAMDALHALRSFTSVRMAAPAVMYLANKRDDATALALDVIRSRLAIHDDESLLETSSRTGDGVRQAFVYAVREALKRSADDPAARADAGARTLDDLVRLVQDVPPLDDPPVDGPAEAGPIGAVLDGEEAALTAPAIDGPGRPLRREHIGLDLDPTAPPPVPAAPLHVEDLLEEATVEPLAPAAPAGPDLAHLPPPPTTPSPASSSAPAPRRRRWRRGS